MSVTEIHVFNSLIIADGKNYRMSIITNFPMELLSIQSFQNMLHHTLFKKQKPQCNKIA